NPGTGPALPHRSPSTGCRVPRPAPTLLPTRCPLKANSHADGCLTAVHVTRVRGAVARARRQDDRSARLANAVRDSKHGRRWYRTKAAEWGDTRARLISR